MEFLNEQMSQTDVFAIEIKQYRAEGRDDLVIVPTLIGRTADTIDKRGQRTARTHEESLAGASEDARELLRRIDELASQLNLITINAPASRVLKTSAREPLAAVFLLSDTLEVSIQPLRERGWSEQADRFLAVLRDITNKAATDKLPTLPIADVIAHWDQVRDVLAGMTALYATPH